MYKCNFLYRNVIFVVKCIFILLIDSCSLKPAYCQERIFTASWYSYESLKKEGTYKYSKGRMANNEYFDENKFTCATRDYSLGTRLKITNLKYPERMVIVEVTDRISKRFQGKRIDFTPAAFKRLAPLKDGLVEVKVEVIR